MALKFKHQAKAEIPAELQSLYVARGGAWGLDVDGAVDRAKLEEFRATNVAVMKERDELKARFEGIDPDEVRKLAEEKRKLEEAQYIACTKYFEGRVPRTRYRLTPSGRRALEAYLNHMEALIQATRRRQG